MAYKKVLLWTIIICLTSFHVSGQGWDVQQSFEGTVYPEQALDLVGCDREFLNVNGWCLLNRDYMPLDDLKLLAMEAANFFGVEEYDLIFSQDTNIRQVNIRGTDGAGLVISITCKSIQVPDSNQGGYESYVLVNMSGDARSTHSQVVRNLLEGFFSTVGAKPTITLTLSGSLEGELDPGRMRSICADILRYLGAREVEGLCQEGLISISGYAPALGGEVISGNRPVNIQVGLRYNSYKGRTYVWIGTPILNIEY